MKKQKSIFFIKMTALASLWLASCSEVKRSYKTYNEAENAGVIDQNSFLPECTPFSAKNITIRYDHDLDKGEGSFEFEKKDAQRFLDKIKSTEPVLAKEMKGKGSETVTVGRHTMKIDWISHTVHLTIVRGD